MNKREQNTKGQTKIRRIVDQSGSMHLVVAAVLAAAAVIGVGVYVWQSQDSKSSEKPSTSTTQSQQPAASGTAVTLLGGKLTMTVPDGWTKGTELNLIKDVDGTSFRVAVQPQGVDYLKLDTVGGYASELSQLKTTQGTALYILKLGKTQDSTNLVVSSCAPTNGFGCSPTFGDSMLYVVLAPLGDGGSALAPLDYNLPATTKAISDFEKIAKALPL